MNTVTESVSMVDPGRPVSGAPATRTFDRMLDTQIAWWTQGLSPASLTAAASDWLVHLGGSPGKQLELVYQTQRQMLRLASLATLHEAVDKGHCIEPLPQDQRFAAPEWQRWPFNIFYQSFLLGQQWWHNATTGVPGVTCHHEQLWTFTVRQSLDMVSPSNFPMTNPIVLERTLRSGGLNLALGMRNMMFDTLGRPYYAQVQRLGKDVAATPGKVIYRNRLIELIEYSPTTPVVAAEPVLIIPPWIMKYYILDLAPETSLVRYLVGKGHTVFMVSWKNPDASDRDLGMDDYLQLGVFDAVEQVAVCRPGHGIHALGYCIGGTLLTIAAAAMARKEDRRIVSLTLLATEVDFSEPGDLGLFIDESQLNFLDNVMASKGYIDGRQMEGAFALLNSKDMVWSRMVQKYLLGQTPKKTDLAAWNEDATRMPLRQQSEYLRRLYLNNDLAQGRYLVDGEAVALSDLSVPIFLLGTERDTVAPWKSVYKLHLLSNTELTFCLTSGGHNSGIVNPPSTAHAHRYQIATRPRDGQYLDPQAWRDTAVTHAGSWWQEWERWLRALTTSHIAAEPVDGHTGARTLCDAPGTYVLVR